MLRLAAACVMVLSSIVCAQAATAAECRFCVDSVVLQTHDGQAWTAGQPVTLVVHVLDNAASALPLGAQVVVMQTDGDRTKCLGVPLKLVQSDATGALYAGLFFPFHPAHYDGVLITGAEVQDVTFDVNRMVAGAAPAGELPAAEPVDTSAPVPVLGSASDRPAVGATGLAVCSLLALVFYTRQRRTRQALVS